MKISVDILYEQLKKDILIAVDKAHTDYNLPVFLVVAALKEIICKYDVDAKSELVRDYQSLLSEVAKDKGEENAENIHTD